MSKTVEIPALFCSISLLPSLNMPITNTVSTVFGKNILLIRESQIHYTYLLTLLLMSKMQREITRQASKCNETFFLPDTRKLAFTFYRKHNRPLFGLKYYAHEDLLNIDTTPAWRTIHSVVIKFSSAVAILIQYKNRTHAQWDIFHTGYQIISFWFNATLIWRAMSVICYHSRDLNFFNNIQFLFRYYWQINICVYLTMHISLFRSCWQNK